jgi:hypothetical protein
MRLVFYGTEEVEYFLLDIEDKEGFYRRIGGRNTQGSLFI